METKQTAQFNRFFALFLSLILFLLFLFSVCVPRAEALTCFVRWSTSARKKPPRKKKKKNVFHCTRFHIVRPNIFLLSKKQGTKEREREQKWNKPKKIVVYCTCTYNDCVVCTTYTAETSYRGYRLNQKSIMGMSITKRTKGFVFLFAFRFSCIFVTIFNGTISK